MLNTGIFPDKLKIAKIIPIHKKEDEKIFEKVIFKQLYPILSRKKDVL